MNVFEEGFKSMVDGISIGAEQMQRIDRIAMAHVERWMRRGVVSLMRIIDYHDAIGKCEVGRSLNFEGFAELKRFIRDECVKLGRKNGFGRGEYIYSVVAMTKAIWACGERIRLERT